MDLKEIYREFINKTGLNYRQQQEDMVLQFADALMKQKVAFIESPTGTGKTIAVLMASIWAIQNGVPQIVISTFRKDLQREYMNTFYDFLLPNIDIFGLSKETAPKIALLKGRSNYISVNKIVKLEQFLNEKELTEEVRSAFKKFKQAIEEANGDIDFLADEFEIFKNALLQVSNGKFKNMELQDLTLPISPTTEEDAKYYLAAKQRAAGAKIIVTNHAMVILYSYLSKVNKNATFPFLPQYLIIDEAHNFHLTAQSILSDKVAVSKLIMIVNDILDEVQSSSDFRGKKVLLRKAEQLLTVLKDSKKRIPEILKNYVGDSHVFFLDSGKVPAIVFSKLADTVSEILNSSRSFLQYIKTPGLEKRIPKTAITYTADFEDKVTRIVEFSVPLRKYSSSLNLFLNTASTYLSDSSDVYYILTFSPQELYPSFARMKPDVSQWLRSNVFYSLPCCIMTSGTLADASSFLKIEDSKGLFIQGNFEYIKKCCGIKNIERAKSVTQVIYQLPFRLKDIYVYIYSNAPVFEIDEDNGEEDRVLQLQKARERLLQYCADVIINRHQESGKTLVLCPSYEDVRILHNFLVAGLRQIDVISQGVTYAGLSVCLDRYRKNYEKNILVVTGGWEGIDLPDEMLKDLYIVRIPFPNPDSPEFQAKERHLIKSGTWGNKTEQEIRKTVHWIILRESIDETFNKTRQGMGRKGRKEGDSGIIHLFDSRILGKNKDGRTSQLYKYYLPYLKWKYGEENVIVV
ncbi:ATP-dependent DNA helicase [Thermodesulfovibrio yellowstonii]|uniref:ATP-dependent DNA helicase n=1 Tax=Thermodesulfovibrio yellowstonii TaxID=28262 RepID=UPI00040CDC6F|nr:ATP-dependent DNA helicase [Thermodesulfovibrio islandicus]